jgi:hypothetical protein
MKKIRILLIMLLAAIGVTSCTKNEYYNTPPQTNSGYKYVFDDNFDRDAHNWSFYDVANSARVNITDGMLKYTYYPTSTGTNTVAIETGVNVDKDFLIQTRIKSDNAMGLVFGVSNSNYGYSFIIDNSGSFAVFKEGSSGSSTQTIIDWQTSNAIQAGWNDLELEQKGNRWIGYINNTQVFDIPSEYLSGVKTGYIVLDGTTGYADYLTIQW